MHQAEGIIAMPMPVWALSSAQSQERAGCLRMKSTEKSREGLSH